MQRDYRQINRPLTSAPWGEGGGGWGRRINPPIPSPRDSNESWAAAAYMSTPPSGRKRPLQHQQPQTFFIFLLQFVFPFSASAALAVHDEAATLPTVQD